MKKFLLGMAFMAGMIALYGYVRKKIDVARKSGIISTLLQTREGKEKLARSMMEPFKPIRKVKLTRKQKHRIKKAQKKSKKGL